MTTAAQAHVQGEDLMAFVDGELTGPELRTIEEHVASCELCAAEIATFQSEARALNAWNVGEVPPQVETNVLAHANKWSAQPSAPKLWALRPQPRWLWGGAAALTATAFTLALIVSGGIPAPPPGQPHAESPNDAKLVEERSAVPSGGIEENYNKAMARSAVVDALRSDNAAPTMAMMAPKPKMMATPPYIAKPTVPARTRSTIATDQQTTAPMIARTVALTLTVKDVERSRQGLEELLRTYNGYAAQMEVSTPEGGTRTLHASLHVPSAQMRGMIAELKGYGKVANETQSGEEVGQQHADLVARLNTARESEERLRAILKNRTGDVSDVLQVEEEIARVRGEIETMEAEQQGLEHRVTYATLDLQMSEEGQHPAGRSAASRLAVGAQQGWDNATETVISFVLFLLQYGLATVLILAMIGIPIWLVWRWKQRVQPKL